MAGHPASLIGRRIGPYKLLSLLGAGGMGEVYRARDDKLGRDVAIKVLPPSVVPDADRVARFEREARMLAALNHPSIAAIYGYEEADGIRGLVLELVEGPTLAERIAAGALSVHEALRIAGQIAEAFEAAHAKGIIHRDLKPGNVKLSLDGRVKVLDFGLAKTFEEELPFADSEAATRPGSPTQAGMILGTAAYMSPEQARGQPVDKRTDIWAFGCVLYEMLTGRMAFAAATMSDVIAGILAHEPNWDALPAKTPPRVRQLLRRCLEKDHRHRLRDIGDARLELNEVLTGAEPTPARAAPRSRRRLAAVGLLALLVSAAAIWIGTNQFQSRLSDGNRASLNSEANAYYERALLFGGAGTSNPEQAQRMIERALALDPSFAAARAENAFFQVAGILNGRSNDASVFYKAEAEIRRALQDDPRCGRAHSVLGLIYLLQGRKELVIGELDQALAENDLDATAHGWLLNYHRFNGDYRRAKQEFDWLVQRVSTFWPAYLDLGEMLREQGDLAGAIRQQEYVLEQDPHNIDALAALIRAYIDSSDLTRARQTLERVRAEDRQNYGLRQQRALLLALEGKKDEAAAEMDAELRRFAEIQIFGPALAADFFAVMGDVDKALEWLDRSVRMGDDREDYLRRNPLLTNLREHPRFKQILDAVAYRRQHRVAR
jgi:serine/threonine protein kinase/tetratricopeptide (TPR) repeat protein